MSNSRQALRPKDSQPAFIDWLGSKLMSAAGMALPSQSPGSGLPAKSDTEHVDFDLPDKDDSVWNDVDEVIDLLSSTDYNDPSPGQGGSNADLQLRPPERLFDDPEFNSEADSFLRHQSPTNPQRRPSVRSQGPRSRLIRPQSPASEQSLLDELERVAKEHFPDDDEQNSLRSLDGEIDELLEYAEANARGSPKSEFILTHDEGPRHRLPKQDSEEGPGRRVEAETTEEEEKEMARPSTPEVVQQALPLLGIPPGQGAGGDFSGGGQNTNTHKRPPNLPALPPLKLPLSDRSSGPRPSSPEASTTTPNTTTPPTTQRSALSRQPTTSATGSSLASPSWGSSNATPRGQKDLPVAEFLSDVDTTPRSKSSGELRVVSAPLVGVTPDPATPSSDRSQPRVVSVNPTRAPNPVDWVSLERMQRNEGSQHEKSSPRQSGSEQETNDMITQFVDNIIAKALSSLQDSRQGGFPTTNGLPSTGRQSNTASAEKKPKLARQAKLVPLPELDFYSPPVDERQSPLKRDSFPTQSSPATDRGIISRRLQEFDEKFPKKRKDQIKPRSATPRLKAGTRKFPDPAALLRARPRTRTPKIYSEVARWLKQQKQLQGSEQRSATVESRPRSASSVRSRVSTPRVVDDTTEKDTLLPGDAGPRPGDAGPRPGDAGPRPGDSPLEMETPKADSDSPRPLLQKTLSRQSVRSNQSGREPQEADRSKDPSPRTSPVPPVEGLGGRFGFLTDPKLTDGQKAELMAQLTQAPLQPLDNVFGDQPMQASAPTSETASVNVSRKRSSREHGTLPIVDGILAGAATEPSQSRVSSRGSAGQRHASPQAHQSPDEIAGLGNSGGLPDALNDAGLRFSEDKFPTPDGVHAEPHFQEEDEDQFLTPVLRPVSLPKQLDSSAESNALGSPEALMTPRLRRRFAISNASPNYPPSIPTPPRKDTPRKSWEITPVKKRLTIPRPGAAAADPWPTSIQRSRGRQSTPSTPVPTPVPTPVSTPVPTPVPVPAPAPVSTDRSTAKLWGGGGGGVEERDPTPRSSTFGSPSRANRSLEPQPPNSEEAKSAWRGSAPNAWLQNPAVGRKRAYSPDSVGPMPMHEEWPEDPDGSLDVPERQAKKPKLWTLPLASGLAAAAYEYLYNK